MKKITLSEYNSISEAYRGVWTTERWDIPDWAEMRKKHIGKRTMMVYDNGTCLLVEGLGFEIVDDSSWKKPDEVRKRKPTWLLPNSYTNTTKSGSPTPKTAR